MEILEFCVQKLQSQNLDKFEIFHQDSSTLGIEVRQNKVDHLSQSKDQGLALRVLKNQKLGFSYTFDLSREAVTAAIRTAVEIAELMPADPLNDLCSYSSVLYPSVENFDRQGLEQPIDRKIEIAKSIEADTLGVDSRIKRVRKAGFSQTAADIVMIDSSGERIRHHQTLFAAQLLCVAEDAGGTAEMGADMHASCFLDGLDYKLVSRTAAMEALELLNPRPAPTMTCPAVFRNSVTAELIGFLSSAFSAESVDKKFSFLCDKKGQKLFSEHLTLIDDGLMPGGIATAPFDGEGCPSQTTKLIEHGTINNYLYDSYYARKFGVKATASSQRGSLKGPPSVGTSNLYLKAGRKSPEELISNIEKGVLITSIMGLHTANPVTGEFSVGASGFLIEKGKLTCPLKGFAIAGNMIDLLSSVVSVGSDLRFWGSTGAASLAVSKLSVGGN